MIKQPQYKPTHTSLASVIYLLCGFLCNKMKSTLKCFVTSMRINFPVQNANIIGSIQRIAVIVIDSLILTVNHVYDSSPSVIVNIRI